MSIHTKFKESITKHNLITKNDRVIVGVSGGPDSVTLIYLLNSLKKEYCLSLLIAHLDHGLRKSSFGDRDLVFKLGKRLNIPVICEKVSLSASDKGSIEETARNARLNFFQRLCKEFKFSKVALGHTMDDQAETILMRVIRGTGLFGLIGIIPLRGIKKIKIIRPLLSITREEINQFIKRAGLETALDETNFTDIYFRNKIRWRLLPALSGYNSNIKEVLCNMAENVSWDYDFLMQAAEGLLKKAITSKSKSSLKLKLPYLSKLHPAMLRLILRLGYKHIKGDTRRLTFRHIKEIESLISSRPTGSIVHLPQNIAVRKDSKTLAVFAVAVAVEKT